MITSLYAGLAALWLLILSSVVIKQRRRFKVGLGTGTKESKAVLFWVRAQANFVEYAPMMLILLYLLEQSGLASGYLHLLGGAFMLSRLAHPFGLALGQGGVHYLRFWGTLMTFACLLLAAILNIIFWFN